MTGRDEFLREITDYRDETLRLQSRVTELTDQVHQAVGLSTAERGLRGKVTGLFFGVLAYLDELNRLVKEEI